MAFAPDRLSRTTSHLAPSLGLAALMLIGTQSLQAQVQAPTGKMQITKASDLPVHTFTIQGKPSEVAQNLDAMLALARQLEMNLKRDLATHEIQDKGLLQGIHTDLFVIAVLKQDPAEAQKQLERVQALMEDPNGRAMAGLVAAPFMAAVAKPGADFHATYRTHLSERLAKLPFQDLKFFLTSSAAAMRTMTKAKVIEGLETGLDPHVKDGKLSQEMTEAILSTAMRLNIHFVVKDDVVACIDALVEAHKNDVPVKFMPVIGTPKTPITGPWFGQPLPGEKPMRFAAEILEAINPWAEGTSFSPDGQTCFLNVGNATYSAARTYQTTCVNGTWTPLVEPPFLAEFSLAMEPGYSPDGQTLVVTGKMAGKSGDLYTVNRTAKGWSTPVAMTAAINTEDDEFRGSATSDGTYYFGRNKAGKMEIHKVTKGAAGNVVVEKLGPPINGQTVDGDPCVAADGRWLVFYSGRPGGQGAADLWVSFSDGKGGWGNPINMGAEFNSPYDEYGAHLSPDGKVLFYTRHTQKGNETYWVSASAIDRYKSRS